MQEAGTNVVAVRPLITAAPQWRKCVHRRGVRTEVRTGLRTGVLTAPEIVVSTC